MDTHHSLQKSVADSEYTEKLVTGKNHVSLRFLAATLI